MQKWQVYKKTYQQCADFMPKVCPGEGLLFGLWLLAALSPRRTWLAALFCFSGFACISLFKAVSGEASCGCFGRVEVNPWYTFSLDTVALAALLWWRPRCVVSVKRSKNQPGALKSAWGIARPLHRLAGVAAIFLGVGIPAALGMGSYRAGTLTETGDILGHGEIVVLEPEAWIGKRFPLLKWIDIGDRLAEGEWTVVLYHHDCPDCQEAIVRFEQLARDAADRTLTPQIALIEIPPYGESGTTTNSRCQHGRLCDNIEWFATTPIELVIEGATVRRLTQQKGNRIPIQARRASEGVRSDPRLHASSSVGSG